MALTPQITFNALSKTTFSSEALSVLITDSFINLINNEELPDNIG